MRVAVIGCGSIGRRHVGNLLALGCDVDAFDLSEEACTRLKAEHPAVHIGIRGFMPHAVVIATPVANHLTFVERAIEYHTPFFVEKPLGTLDQLPRWRELAAAALPINQVGYMLRFHPKVKAMKAHLQPCGGQFYVRCDSRMWPGFSYGPMLLELSHEIDLALYFGAPPVVDDGELGEHDVQLCLGTEFGSDWTVELADRAPEYFRQWIVSDSRGSEINFVFRAPEELGVEMYRDEIAHFLDCVNRGVPTACTLADGVATLDVCAQVQSLTMPTVPPNRFIREGSLS